MSQPVLNRQQILSAALTAFNQQGDIVTLNQLAARLSIPPSSLHPYFSGKLALIKQLVRFALAKPREPLAQLPRLSAADEFQDLLAAYQRSLTAFSETALFNLRLYYPEEWGKILRRRESQWQKIIVAIEAGCGARRRCSVDTGLLQIMVDGILLTPFFHEHFTLPELMNILLFGIAQRAE